MLSTISRKEVSDPIVHGPEAHTVFAENTKKDRNVYRLEEKKAQQRDLDMLYE